MRTLPAAALGTTALVLATTLPASAADRRAVVDTYAAIAHAMYADSLLAAHALRDAVIALVEAPSDVTLARARGAWLAARVPYQQSEVYRFGNPLVDEWEGKVNAWPLDEGLIDDVELGAYGLESDENLLFTANVIASDSITFGGQFQDLALPAHAIEGRIHIDWTEEEMAFADGAVVSLRRSTASITDLGYGPTDPALMMSLRVAPAMIGPGLLEAIPDDAILALTDADDLDGDGISGRANWVWSGEAEALALGRFGWKATEPTLNQQNLSAFAGDIGMSSSLVPSACDDCTEAQAACRAGPHGTDDRHSVEIADELAEALLFYTRTLAVPARRDLDDLAVRNGEDLFAEAGCAACHTPSFETTPDTALAALAGQRIWPYTDLLLHDMGEGSADNRPVAQASGREWRTPPLWGIGLTRTVSGHSYFLHDGRARSLTEAILWHGGEAEAAREAFRTMPADDRSDLLSFLESL